MQRTGLNLSCDHALQIKNTESLYVFEIHMNFRTEFRCHYSVLATVHVVSLITSSYYNCPVIGRLGL